MTPQGADMVCVCGHSYQQHRHLDPRFGVWVGGACKRCKRPECLTFTREAPQARPRARR
jgi:hypothetical protein